MIAATDIDLVKYIADNAGAFIFLILAVFGVYKGWWIPGPEHRRQIAELQRREEEAKASSREWKNMALHGIEQAERGLGVAEKLTART